MIESFGRIAGDAPPQNLAFPSIRRRLKTLQLAEDFQQAALTRDLRARSQVLPAQEPAHELRGRYRLDLLAQFSYREAVNAGEQAAVAPFGFLGLRIVLPARGIGELAAQDGAVRFQAEQAFGDLGGQQAEDLA
jgi:hypothetical protein